MNTKIGSSFGLALLMVIGVLAAMFAMGSFSAKPVSAAIGVVDTVVTPTTAGATGQYTITVTGAAGGAGITAIPVGGTLTVTFGSKFTVPSSIDASAVKLKAAVVDGGTGAAGRLNSASAITVDGRAVTITVPDMDSATGTGDDGIGASTGTGADVVITFTQAAGIVNPNVYQAAQTSAAASPYSGTLRVKSSADTTAITSSLTAISKNAKFSPTTAARAATLTVTGGGFNTSCDDCKIRLSPQNGTAPTTGTGGVAFNGSGTIDSSGVFAGTILLSSTTKAGGYVWITDKRGVSEVSTTTFVQKAGATPTSTSSKPGSTVTVDLVDFEPADTITGVANVTIGGTAAENATSPGITEIPSTGSTTSLVPFKFKVPASIGEGVHRVNFNLATKDASFDLTIGLRSISVTPATAVPGQSITLSGTGYDTTSGTIAAGALTIKSATSTTTASVNGAAITIDNTGAWSYATTFPYFETTSGSGKSNTITFTATDSASLVGESDTSFKRTTKTVTLSPTTISPGGALTVTVAGFAADNGTVADQDAEFTVTMHDAQTGGNAITLTGTSIFPIGSDGTGTGIVTIPTSGTGVNAGTKYITVTDNYKVIGVTAAGTRNGADSPSTNNSKQVSVKIPKGTVTVTPLSASTGNMVTITGTGYPPLTTASSLEIGGADAMPSGGIITDAAGSYTQIVEVPAATTGGSLTPGTQIIETTVGAITGSTTLFSTPNPSITITPAEASVEETITVTGTGFNSLGTVTSLVIGSASALPSPAPRATRNGEITAEVTVPLLNAGSYTLTMSNASAFSGSATFTATAAKVVAASTADNTETVFADVIANDDSLVRVWRFSNADQSWSFYDPRPAFASANTLVKTGAGDIVWVNVTAEQAFQSGTLFPGWNLISLN
jgi:hypothetical protein